VLERGARISETMILKEKNEKGANKKQTERKEIDCLASSE
jgi:hypothetical protein